MLLLLAGTSEARRIAGALAAEGIPAVASLAGATRMPEKLALETRVGGFGGRQGFIDFLQENAITAILDATHPFAAEISARTANVASSMAIPHLLLLRPPWRPSQGDDWTMIARESDAARHIAPGSTVFLATGRQSLEGFANLEGRRLICRRIDPPRAPFPYANGTYLLGRGPFTVDDEIALFEQLGVDVLVVKNAGGESSRAKLDAARALSIPVIMIERPPPPAADTVATVAEALDWVRGLA